MKVFISVDLEGIACVVCPVETQLEGVDYEKARSLMTGEARAAAEAARAAGATEIVVADSHGHMRNLLPEGLPEYVRLVRGAQRPLSMVQGLDAGCAVALFVGYHAGAGTAQGIMNHSFLGRVIGSVRLNDITVGETGFNAAVAGAMGVPVALVSGDQALADEAAGIVPWAERVVVKTGISSWSAESMTPAAAQAAIGRGCAAGAGPAGRDGAAARGGAGQAGGGFLPPAAGRPGGHHAGRGAGGAAQRGLHRRGYARGGARLPDHVADDGVDQPRLWVEERKAASQHLDGVTMWAYYEAATPAQKALRETQHGDA